MFCFAGDGDYTKLKFRSGRQSDATSLALILDAAGRKVPAYFGAYTPLMANRFLSLGEKESVQMQKAVHIARTGK